VELASRLLCVASDSTLQHQLAGRLVDELRRIPVEERLRLRGEWDDGEAAVIETAAGLNGDDLRDLGGAIESLAGRPLGISVQVRPDLLGGVRLRIGGHVWDASMAGRLEELETSAAGGASKEASAP
jgi:F-type H+-transporting ATPase subunit delta